MDNDFNEIFLAAVEATLRHEGGYVDHPNDPGGATNFGISLRFYRKHVDASASPSIIRNLTRDDAICLYHRHFWAGRNYNKLDHNLGAKCFDLAVNMGHRRATRLLQRALKAHGFDLSDDGVFGEKTLVTAEEAGASALPALASEQAGYYRLLVCKRKSFKPFLIGWLKRAYG